MISTRLISLDILHPSDANQRIDKFLKKYLPEAPLSGIYKWLRTGKIKVNHKKVEQTYKIELDDTIEIWLTEAEILGFQKPIGVIAENIRRENQPSIEELILYEDEHYIIINKPPKLNVHPGDHKTNEVSLIEQVHDYLGKKYESLSFRPSLIHRIDRDTSGAIMIAKDKPTLGMTLHLLQHGKIEKIYHTIVIGTPEKARDTIRAKLRRNDEAKNEAKVQVDPRGQEAISHYTTLGSKLKGRYSLLEVKIETGRTHQIRVHMAYIGCPVLGDASYGERGENAYAKKTYNIHRQMLHAQKLVFQHPHTKKQIEIIAPYLEDMSSLTLI